MEKNDKEDFISEVVDLAYKVLYQIIPIEELDTYDDSVKSEVIKFLNKESGYKVCFEFDRKLIYDALKNAKTFDLMEFLDRPDYDYQFSYECPYNRKAHKAALGYITKSEAIYCDVPIGTNHAEVVTEMHRIMDPEYEDLSLYREIHGDDENGGDWHNKVMNDEGCIIIHFMPNVFGAAVFIPSEINDFQYQELLKLNSMLLEKGIIAETNKDDNTLTEYLEKTVPFTVPFMV